MSTNNTSTSNVTQDLSIALIIGLGIAIYRYQNQITELITALIYMVITVSAITLLGTMIYYTIKWAPIPHNKTGTDVDLTTFGTPEWNEDEEETTTNSEPETVQENPAKQETVLTKITPIIKILEINREDELLSVPLHHAEKLSQTEISRFERNGYILKEFVPLGKTRREKYYIKEQKPESYEHTFVVYSIVEKLKPLVQSIEVNRTQQPDITFYHQGHEHAIEVETPRALPHKHSRLRNKSQRLNRQYGVNWWFVTTRSAYAKTFASYGSVLTRNQIDQWIQETFTPQTPSP